MEKRMFAEKAPRVDTAKVYRALAMLALLPSCVLAGCAGEKGVDAGSPSSAPYGDSEKGIDIEKNSIYYSDKGIQEGFSVYCTGSPEEADCPLAICDGDDLVTFKFYDIDFTEQIHGQRTPLIKPSYLINKTRTLAMEYDAYIPTDITKNVDTCQEKKRSTGQFTKPVSFPYGENEQYLCLPQLMTTIDGENVAWEITKTTSTNKENSDPNYKLSLSEECFDPRTSRD